MLIESISGIRGVVGTGLTPKKVMNYASGFGEWAEKGKIIIGRDSRPSGKVIADLFSNTLSWMGFDVIDIGIVPTPTVQFITEKFQAAGGVVITASHNPFPWNGIKFIAPTGLFLDADQVAKVLNFTKNKEFSFKKSGGFGNISEYSEAIDDHIKNILGIPYLDIEKIRSKNFKVVIDAVNGGGSIALPKLLNAFGCEIIKVNCVPDGHFPHLPEPLPENLTDLLEKVKENKADIGMAVDPDADRLAIVDENGKYLSEEYTLVMSLKTVLEKNTKSNPVIVTNLSTTLAVDKIADQYNAKVIRTAIGEINVSKKMKEINSLIGGEGNGGIILPDSHLGRDSLVGAALILQFLVDGDEKLSEKYKKLPQFKMSKMKAEVGNKSKDKIIENLINKYKNENINTVDGIKIIFENSWVHIRKSNTEPILRVYSEATKLEEAVELGKRFVKKIDELCS
ncbi:MAG: phosphoglucosamine mutase [Candidatus Marinimicrobia bacterium]|nr:phosphoglucosamine mutase [Candidatus Neomarinimicrobiota bacterium]